MGDWDGFIRAGVERQDGITKIGDDGRVFREKMDTDFTIKNLQDENEHLQEENNRLKSLLSKPFKEIAEVNGNFKETYEKQQDILADWILSQQAFRETAIEFGIELGKSLDEIKEVVIENQIAVLENRTQHNNNATEFKTLAERREKILSSKKVGK